MTIPVCVLTVFVAAPGSGDLAREYQAAQASLAGQPDAPVRLALWCEQHGLPYERARHLALALMRNPDDTRARALLGMVKLAGRWRDAESAAAEPVPAIRARYNARRAVMDVNRA